MKAVRLFVFAFLMLNNNITYATDIADDNDMLSDGSPANISVDGDGLNHHINNIEGLYNACRQVILHYENKDFNPMGFGLCYGFFRGVKNSYDIQQLANGRKRGNICPPKNVTWLQLIKAFISWVESYPVYLHEKAWVGAVKSMSYAFPCYR